MDKKTNKVKNLITACENLFDSGKVELAGKKIRLGVSKYPNDPVILSTAAIIFFKSNKFSIAENFAKKMIMEKSSNVESRDYFIYAMILEKNKKINLAEKYYRKSIDINPNSYEQLRHFANFLLGIGNVQECKKILSDTILKINKFDYEAKYLLSHAQLMSGEYEEGWKNNEYRLDISRLKKNHLIKFKKIHDGLVPQWRGESLKKKIILIHNEQGIGDDIQFSRYIYCLRSYQPKKIILFCRPALESLFLNSDIYDEVITEKDKTKLNNLKFDYYSQLMSLPNIMQVNEYDINTNFIPYLKTSKKEYNQIQNHEKHLKVGFCWKGNPEFDRDYARSMSSVAELELIFNIDNIEFFNLQPDKSSKCESYIHKKTNLFDCAPFINDYQDTVNILSKLDLIITTDTSIVHAAGALGKNCWLLLSNFHSDWRWGLDNDESIWYPTIRIFRQKEYFNWDGPLGEVRKELERLLG